MLKYLIVMLDNNLSSLVFHRLDKVLNYGLPWQQFKVTFVEMRIS